MTVRILHHALLATAVIERLNTNRGLLFAQGEGRSRGRDDIMIGRAHRRMTMVVFPGRHRQHFEDMVSDAVADLGVEVA